MKIKGMILGVILALSGLSAFGAMPPIRVYSNIVRGENQVSATLPGGEQVTFNFDPRTKRYYGHIRRIVMQDGRQILQITTATETEAEQGYKDLMPTPASMLLYNPNVMDTE